MDIHNKSNSTKAMLKNKDIYANSLSTLYFGQGEVFRILNWNLKNTAEHFNTANLKASHWNGLLAMNYKWPVMKTILFIFITDELQLPRDFISPTIPQDL